MPKLAFPVVVDLASPLSHGSLNGMADLGNLVAMRQEPLIGESGVVMVPCVSGNAVRGVLRRLLIRELLATCEIDRASLAEALGDRAAFSAWDRLYAALALGGTFEEAEKSVNPARHRAMRTALPPLSLLGSAMFGEAFAGMVSVGFAWPVCRETVAAGVVDAGKDHPCAGIRADDLLTERDFARHADREWQVPEESKVGPMPYTVEALPTGARLVCELRLQPHATEIEASCLAHGLLSVESLGGKSAAGFGSVRVGLPDSPSPDLYRAWLADPDRRSVTKGDLVDLAARLSQRKDKAKAGKTDGDYPAV